MDYEEAFRAILEDARYQRNLDWGAPRPGHPEGTVRAHIAELERNLEALETRLSGGDPVKLKLLIHTHDSFKPDATPGVPIMDPASHASIARAFLAEFCDDADLLAMVQHHDEPFALWRQTKFQGACAPQRMARLIHRISDWNLFLAFVLIDGCTVGKSREPLRWLFNELQDRVSSRWTAEDIF